MVVDSDASAVLDALWVDVGRELRSLGITLRMSWDQYEEILTGDLAKQKPRRRLVSDASLLTNFRSVPVGFLLAPNADHLSAIARECKAARFGTISIAFLSGAQPSLLRQLAQELILATEGVSRQRLTPITKITDAYTAFCALEEDCFSLASPGAFKVFFDHTSSESMVNLLTDRVVLGLMSVFATLRALPIIYTQQGGPAENVAMKLHALLRDSAMSGEGPFASSGRGSLLGFRRPVLILFDRTFDIGPMLHLDWSYASLLESILGMSNGRIANLSSSGVKRYVLERSDRFWRDNMWNPFPRVAENIEQELASYRNEVDSINKMRTASLSSSESEGTAMSASRLAEAISSLPQLTRRKDAIDQHTELATQLLEEIKRRGLDMLIELEGQLLKKELTDKSAVLSALSDSRASKADKLRLFVIYYLYAPELSVADVEMSTRALQDAGCDLELLKFLKTLRQPSADHRPQIGLPAANRQYVKSLLGNVVDRGVKGLTQVATKAKARIVQVDSALPAARLVRSLLDGEDEQMSCRFRTLDPNSAQTSAGLTRFGHDADHVIVFPVGGGCYFEYANIVHHIKGRNVCYGSTSLYAVDDFLAEMMGIQTKRNIDQ
uniref:Sec1 family domain-containing protein 1 n=2 Tax=Compsopogon caeruleus TaxID=31354 RepID=A0A7S1XG44_9RHOD